MMGKSAKFIIIDDPHSEMLPTPEDFRRWVSAFNTSRIQHDPENGTYFLGGKL